MPAQSVLIPLDGSPHRQATLTAVGQHFDPQTDTVTLLRIGPPPRVALGAELAHLWLDSQLQAAAQQLRAQGYTVRTAIRLGDPATAIMQVAQQEASTVIMLVTPRRGWRARLGLGVGGVAEQIRRQAQVPVLLLHPARQALPPFSRVHQPTG